MAGVGAIIGKSFARIYYRNCINNALPALTCAEAVDALQDGERGRGRPRGRRDSLRGAAPFTSRRLPNMAMEMMAAGGLIPYTRKKAGTGIASHTEMSKGEKSRMAKYKIAWMPGDGVGNDVMEATKIVLDKMAFGRRVRAGRHRLGVLVHGGRPAAPTDAGHCCKQPTARSLARSRPSPRMWRTRSWSPNCRARGSVYRSPIVRLRQTSGPLYLPAAVQGLSGQPAELQRRHRLVVFRENTEGMYIGVEYAQMPEAFYTGPRDGKAPA